MTFRSYLDGSTRFMGPETSMEVQAALRLRHRARVRRVHAVPRRPRLHRALDRAHPPLARPLPRLARRARAGRPARVRDRPGRGGGGPAPRVGPGGRRAARRRDRDRRHARRGQGPDVRGRRLGDRRARLRAPPPPARDRRGRRPRARRRAGDRHVRLRDADPHRPPRHGARARPREPLARRSRQGPLPHRRRAAARRLPVPRLRARLHAAPTCTTCSRRTSRRPSACSRSTTSPTSSA